jgi:hypothetical protein
MPFPIDPNNYYASYLSAANELEAAIGNDAARAQMKLIQGGAAQGNVAQINAALKTLNAMANRVGETQSNQNELLNLAQTIRSLGGDIPLNANKQYLEMQIESLKEKRKREEQYAFNQANPSPAEEAQLQSMNQAEKKMMAEKKSAASTVANTITEINKYITPDGAPTLRLDKAVGAGEGVQTFLGNLPWVGAAVGNTKQTISDQKQLNLKLIQPALLESVALLRPASDTDITILKENLPKITDSKEVWVDYLKDYREKIAMSIDPNVAAADAASLDRASKTKKLQALTPTQ